MSNNIPTIDADTLNNMHIGSVVTATEPQTGHVHTGVLRAFVIESDVVWLDFEHGDGFNVARTAQVAVSHTQATFHSMKARYALESIESLLREDIQGADAVEARRRLRAAV